MSPCWLYIDSLTRWPGSGLGVEKNFDTVLLGQRMVSLALNSHTNLISQNVKLSLNLIWNNQKSKW